MTPLGNVQVEHYTHFPATLAYPVGHPHPIVELTHIKPWRQLQPKEEAVPTELSTVEQSVQVLLIR